MSAIKKLVPKRHLSCPMEKLGRFHRGKELQKNSSRTGHAESGQLRHPSPARARFLLTCKQPIISIIIVLPTVIDSNQKNTPPKSKKPLQLPHTSTLLCDAIPGAFATVFRLLPAQPHTMSKTLHHAMQRTISRIQNFPLSHARRRLSTTLATLCDRAIDVQTRYPPAKAISIQKVPSSRY